MRSRGSTGRRKPNIIGTAGFFHTCCGKSPRAKRMKFPSTRLSAVLAARSDDHGERRRGFEALVAAYWKPVYKFVRIKWSCSPDDAEDLTQGFFTCAIEKRLFASYDAGKGSFRTYLRMCLDGYVANERKSASRLKRGGGEQLLSLDFAS